MNELQDLAARQQQQIEAQQQLLAFKVEHNEDPSRLTSFSIKKKVYKMWEV